MFGHVLSTTQSGTFFLFEINGPILSRLTTGKKKSLNMCPCADKANSTGTWTDVYDEAEKEKEQWEGTHQLRGD